MDKNKFDGRVSPSVLESTKDLEQLAKLVSDYRHPHEEYHQVFVSRFINRYKWFKESLGEEFPDLTQEELLFLDKNAARLERLRRWSEYDDFMAMLEFETIKFPPQK